MTHKYLIIVETVQNGFSAYSPDLPGCVSTGASKAEVETNMREAISFHLEGLTESGQVIPKPSATATYIESIG